MSRVPEPGQDQLRAGAVQGVRQLPPGADAELGENVAQVPLTDELQAALAAAPGDQIVAAATPWSHDEEWDGVADPETLANFLLELADLARQAGQRGERLYCWICL
jgi:hypothetical protein